MIWDKDGMMEEVKTSIRNRRTDYIDLYQIHNIDPIEELELTLKDHGAYAALKELKREGMIRHIGITSYKAGVIEKTLDTDFSRQFNFP